MNPFSFFADFGKKASAVASSVAFTHFGRASWSGRSYENFADEGYCKNVIVFTCVDIIATAAASVPWYINSTDKKKKDPANPELQKLLDSPNPSQKFDDLIRELIAYRLITGNSYLERVMYDTRKGVGELYALRPDRMTIVPGGQGFPLQYEYKVGDKTTVFPVDQITGKSNIKHLKKFNPTNDWYGLSPMAAASWSIDQHNSASIHNKSLLDNGATPSGALLTEAQDLSPEQFNKLEKRLQEKYQGPKNAGRPMLLNGLFKWLPMGMSPKDLDWINGKDVSAREVGLVFKVPSQLLGIQGSQTFANYEQAMLYMWQFGVIPELKEICAVLNGHVVAEIPTAKGLSLAYDLDAVDALNPLREKLWGRLEKSKTAGIVTINEAREAMGYSPLPGGDELYTPAAQLPLSFDRSSLMDNTTPTA